MEKKEIAELFMKGIDCSQVVVGALQRSLELQQRKLTRCLQHLAAVWVLVRLVVLLSEQ